MYELAWDTKEKRERRTVDTWIEAVQLAEMVLVGSTHIIIKRRD